MQYIQLIPDLLNIARQAGDVILHIYRQSEQPEVEHKADNSPLTLADRASNSLICKALVELPVAYPIISEESKMQPWELRKKWSHCWLVDPLDGTKEFIKRNGDFTVNIALVENGRAVIGVVHTPVHNELCWAVKGQGAFLVKNGHQMPIEAASFSESDPDLAIVCSRSHLTKETEDFIAKYKTPQLVSRGSALKFLLLAKGEAHVYPRIAPTMEWDTAAAQIILEEAGGKVVLFDSGQPLTYNREELRNPPFIAYGRVREFLE